MKLGIPTQKTFSKMVWIWFSLGLILFVTRIGGELNKLVAGFVYLATFFLEVATIWWTVKSYGLKNPQGKAFFVILLGFISATVGQSLWFIQLYLFQVSPAAFTSIFYYLAYLAIFVGFTMEIMSMNINWSKLYLPILIPAIFTAMLFMLLVTVFELKPLMDNGISTLTEAVNLGYVMFDFGLIILGVLLLRLVVDFGAGAMSKAWLMIFTAQFMILVGDILLAAFGEQYAADIWPFTLINFIWLTANLFLASGFFQIGDSIRQAQKIMHRQQPLTMK